MEHFSNEDETSFRYRCALNEHPMEILEHDQTDKELEVIRKLSAEYKLPADASESYAALYAGLEAFDRDMQKHIEFENNFLFPRAVAMEEEACGRGKTAKV